VTLTGSKDGLFPLGALGGEPGGLEESDGLCDVGLTRAQRKIDLHGRARDTARTGSSFGAVALLEAQALPAAARWKSADPHRCGERGGRAAGTRGGRRRSARRTTEEPIGRRGVAGAQRYRAGSGCEHQQVRRQAWCARYRA